MTALQRFYQWVIDSPPLLEIKPPISDLGAFSSHLEIDESHTYNGNPRLGFLYQHLCEQVIIASDNYSIKHDEIQINVEGRTLGAIDFIRKPIDNEKLSDILNAYGIYSGDKQASDRHAPPASVDNLTLEDQFDAYREMVNIAMGRAGENLAELFGEFERIDHRR